MSVPRHLTRLLDPNLDRTKYTDVGLLRELLTIVEIVVTRAQNQRRCRHGLAAQSTYPQTRNPNKRRKTNMRLSDMKTPGKYLKKENLAQDRDTIVTIAHGGKEQVGQGANKEEKYVLYFREMQTGLIVNNTNADAIAMAHPVNDDKDLVGKTLALYVDPTVTFGSNAVGGIRVRPEAPPAVGAYDLGDVPAPV